MNDRQNPVRLLEYNKDNKYDYLRLFGNAYADLELIKNLHIKTSFGIDYGFFKKRSLQRSYQSGYLQNNQTSVTMEQSVNDKWTWTNTANYSLKCSEKIDNFELYLNYFLEFKLQTNRITIYDLNNGIKDIKPIIYKVLTSKISSLNLDLNNLNVVRVDSDGD